MAFGLLNFLSIKWYYFTSILNTCAFLFQGFTERDKLEQHLRRHATHEGPEGPASGSSSLAALLKDGLPTEPVNFNSTEPISKSMLEEARDRHEMTSHVTMSHGTTFHRHWPSLRRQLRRCRVLPCLRVARLRTQVHPVHCMDNNNNNNTDIHKVSNKLNGHFCNFQTLTVFNLFLSFVLLNKAVVFLWYFWL